MDDQMFLIMLEKKKNVQKEGFNHNNKACYG